MTTTTRRWYTTTAATTSHSTRQFHYDPARRTFTAEVSDLSRGLDGRTRPVFGPVWPDSADEGFAMVSSTTGQVIWFVVTDEHRDAEGDVTHWTLESVTDTRQDGRFAATVFND